MATQTDTDTDTYTADVDRDTATAEVMFAHKQFNGANLFKDAPTAK